MNYKFEEVDCCICGSDKKELISNKGKFNFPTNVVLCSNCGLGFLNPRWDAGSYLDFYKNEYDKYYRPDLTKRYDESKVNPIIERLKLLNRSPNNAKYLLDIGSGAGDNLRAFHKEIPECNLFAIEPSLESQGILKKNNIQVIGDNVDSNWEAKYNERFDIIVMRHVLEHFMNPVQIMRKVNQVLSESGVLYLAVPDSLNPTQNLEKSWFRNVHTYYFNKYSLINLMALTGFNILKVVEGDEFACGEVFLVATKSNDVKRPTFSTQHFDIQNDVFRKKIRQEERVVYKGISLLKKIVRRVLYLIRGNK